MPTVGVIGAGYWGQHLVRNFHELQALAAVCDSDQNRRQVMADRYAGCATFTGHAGLLKDESIADVTVSLLSFPSSVKASIVVSWLHPYKEQKLVVVGDHAMAVFDDVEEQDTRRLRWCGVQNLHRRLRVARGNSHVLYCT